MKGVLVPLIVRESEGKYKAINMALRGSSGNEDALNYREATGILTKSKKLPWVSRQLVLAWR